MMLRNLLAFGRLLRRLGLDVHPGRMLDVAEALPYVDIRVRADVYHACRALLVHRYEDLALFDRAFDAFWSDRRTDVLRRGETAASEAAGTAATPVEQNLSSAHPVLSSAHPDLRSAHRDSSPAPHDASSAAEDATALPMWNDAATLADKD